MNHGDSRRNSSWFQTTGKMVIHCITLWMHSLVNWGGSRGVGVQRVRSPSQIWEEPVLFMIFRVFYKYILCFFHNVMVPFLSWTPPPSSEKLDPPQANQEHIPFFMATYPWFVLFVVILFLYIFWLFLLLFCHESRRVSVLYGKQNNRFSISSNIDIFNIY